MRLPWHKSRIPAERFEEARAVAQASQDTLERVRARVHVDAAQTRRLSELRERNHFSEGLRAMLRAEDGRHAPNP